MKKIIYTLCLSFFVLSFMGCKKGENDPFMSLKSRKARLAGEWKVTANEQTYSYTSTFGSNSSTTTYNGSTETEKEMVGGGVEIITVREYTIEYVFEKDGTYSITQTEDGESYVIKGHWSFIGKSKKAELKNKEAIALTYDSETFGGEGITYSGSFFPFETIIIDQLKSKEIIFTYDESSTSPSSTTKRTGKMTLTQK